MESLVYRYLHHKPVTEAQATTWHVIRETKKIYEKHARKRGMEAKELDAMQCIRKVKVVKCWKQNGLGR